MAKVGNEAKLILRLAEEQMREKTHKVVQEEVTGTYREGYLDAMTTYMKTLDVIVSDLERKS